ncbi:hypothetical protein EHQ42_04400 [Leptospira levettii]|uniref:hypothetical protein n=1 Tax=Leptospira levettii TaxID=2023178 RepID=UPI0010830489|nr:hypothetical protein [Leptospira levettii]TGL22094.1 hypothetical protein EHQ42_04400 [Leptospira levettii]
MKFKLTPFCQFSKSQKIILVTGLVLFLVGAIFYSNRKYRENQFSDTIVCLSGDCASGFGKIQYPSGEIYSGQLSNKIPNGKGKMEFKDKAIYEGDWEMGQIEGYGIYTYPDQNIFSGKFRKNKREGFGKFTIGRYSIQGKWVKDFLEGEALLGYEGKKWSGFYQKGKLISGYGILFYPEGKRYIGQAQSGKRNGIGHLENGKGEILEKGNWKDDRKI